MRMNGCTWKLASLNARRVGLNSKSLSWLVIYGPVIKGLLSVFLRSAWKCIGEKLAGFWKFISQLTVLWGCSASRAWRIKSLHNENLTGSLMQDHRRFWLSGWDMQMRHLIWLTLYIRILFASCVVMRVGSFDETCATFTSFVECHTDNATRTLNMSDPTHNSDAAT